MAKKNFIAEGLIAGGVGVVPTDTMYGIVGSALNKKTVARIYRLRERDRKKPLIVLINSVADLKKFGVSVSAADMKVLKKSWPGKVSVILPCPHKKFSYLHRGTKSIAFRLPNYRWLRALLKQTGSLVAPSANLQGKPPATTIRAAQKYFGADVDFYADAGTLSSMPSTIIALRDGKTVIIRR